MSNNWKVYAHITPSNKYYIGITSNILEKRWRNGYGYKNHKVFYRAILKYGWTNIDHVLLASGLTKKEAVTFEKLLILKLNSNGDNGYNCTDGGEDGSRTIYTYMRNKKISEKNKGVPKYKHRKPIICISTNEVFDSIKSGAKEYNLDPSALSKCCRGISKNCGKLNGNKLQWDFYKGEIK